MLCVLLNGLLWRAILWQSLSIALHLSSHCVNAAAQIVFITTTQCLFVLLVYKYDKYEGCCCKIDPCYLSDAGFLGVSA